METSDTIEVVLPSGKKALVRSYTTHGDDRQAEALLNKGLSVTSDDDGKTSRLNFGADAIAASNAKYVELLTVSIDGDTSNIQKQLDALRTEDYNAIDVAVRGITSIPKATPTKN